MKQNENYRRSKMSNQDVQREVAEYVKAISFGVLAYVRADGTPIQRTFGAFAISGNDILLATKKVTAKVAAIVAQPKVSFFVENRDQKLPAWKSALYIGTAAAITDEKELHQAAEAISARNAFIKELLAREGLKQFEVLRLKTHTIEWLDYGKGFGHVDTVEV
jgi:general stress protein 26